MPKKPSMFEQRRRAIDKASGWDDPVQKKKKPKVKPKTAKPLPPLGKKYDPADYPR